MGRNYSVCYQRKNVIVLVCLFAVKERAKISLCSHMKSPDDMCQIKRVVYIGRSMPKDFSISLYVKKCGEFLQSHIDLCTSVFDLVSVLTAWQCAFSLRFAALRTERQ